MVLWTAALAACGGNDEPEEPKGPTLEDIKKGDTAERTILVYISAENSLDRYFSSDLDEMEAAIPQVSTGKNAVLVYVDDHSKPRLLHLMRMTDGTAVRDTLKVYDELDSSTTDAFTQVCKDALGKYPAQHYDLVLWSHGEGWIPSAYTTTKAVQRASAISTDNVTQRRWWSIDNNVNSTTNSGSYMDISDLANALKATVHFDTIIFDSCFMMSIEALYTLRDCADYFIGSPNEIPGPGANYTVLLPALTDGSTDEQHAMIAASAYFDPYNILYVAGTYPTDNDWTSGVAISMVKASAIPALAAATKAALPQLVTDGQSPVYSNVMCYDNTRSSYRYYHDFKEFMEQQAGDNTELIAEWEQAFSQAVIYWAYTPTCYSTSGSNFITFTEACGGLSMFIPRLAKMDLVKYFRQTEWYQASGWNQTGW
jgi:hypothetical protein